MYLQWFSHIWPSTFGHFCHQNGDRRADHPLYTQKRRKCRPSGAQCRPSVPKRPPGGGAREDTFSIIFHQFSSSTPLGARSVPEVRFLTVLGRCRSIWERFWVDLGSIFGDCSSILDRGGNRPGCHNDPRRPEKGPQHPRNRSVDRSTDRSFHRSIDPSARARWRVCRRQLDSSCVSV